MCQKLGESLTAPLTGAASGVMIPSDGIGTTFVWCNRTDCPSYGKWWCAYTGW